MSNQTSGELEHEAEKIRANIAQTAEALQDRMSPGKMVDELMGYLKKSDNGSAALDTLGRQVRENPLALAMMGAGAAWLMFGGGSSAGDGRGRSDRFETRSFGDRSFSSRDIGDRSFADRDFGDGEPGRAASQPRSGGGRRSYAPAVGDAASGLADKASGLVDKASALAHQTQDAAGAASERLRDAVGGGTERLRGYGQDASATGRRAAESLRDYADSGRRGMMDALDREPLVLGAIGLAVGAALGAMLPSTRLEDETFGEARDALLRDAGRVVDRAAESAQQVASEAFAAAKSASEKEGLTIEGKPIVERLGEVAKAAIAAGGQATEQGAADVAEVVNAPEGSKDRI